MATNEHIIKAPGMMKNLAVGGHLTTADQVLDDSLNKDQKVINQERIADNAALDGKITTEKNRAEAAEELLRQAYEALSQSTPVPVTELPESGEEGVIYRLAGETSYSDYMWNGEEFVKMAEYDNAIDDNPTVDSDNLVKSGGVERYTKNAASLTNAYFNIVPLEQGWLDVNTGQHIDNTTKVVSKYYVPSKSVVKVKNGYVIFGLYKFKPNNTNGFDFISYTGYQNTTQLTVTDDAFVYCFCFAKADNSDILPTEDIIDVLYNEPIDDGKAIVSGYSIKMSDATNGRYWDLSGELGSKVSYIPIEHPGDNYRACDEIQVKAGDVFVLTTKGGVNARAYAITDKNRSILYKADANAYIMGRTVNITEDGFLFVNCSSECYSMFFLKKLYALELTDKLASYLFNYKSYGLKEGAYWLTNGASVTNNPQENADYAYSNEIPVKKGDIFLLTTKGGENARAYAFTDTDKNIIAVADSNAYLYNQEVSVTEDGFMYVNCAIDYLDKFSLQKKSFDGKTDSKLSGDYKLLTPIETILNSYFDYKGDIYTANNFEIKVFSTQKDCEYRINTRIANSSAKDERAFAFMFNDDVKVGPVPLGLPIYSTNGNFSVKCDGSFNKLYVYGLSGTPSVCEKTLPVFNAMTHDLNGIALSNDNHLDIIQGASLVAMIQHWGFIGDSFVSGCFEYKEDGITKYTNNNYAVSPPQIMMRINGCEGYNFSMGGETAKQWCGGVIGHIQDADREWVENGDCKVKQELKQAYYVQLGSNDAISGGISIGNLDTDVDPIDYHNNDDTFAGWYAGVIQRVLSVNPKAYFFISTLRLTHAVTRRMDASNIIRAIPKFFKDNGITNRIFVVDQEKYGLDWNAPRNAPYYNGGHPTALGQYYIATWINTYINNVIRQNMLAFNEIQFVGTDKHYN